MPGPERIHGESPSRDEVEKPEEFMGGRAGVPEGVLRYGMVFSMCIQVRGCSGTSSELTKTGKERKLLCFPVIVNGRISSPYDVASALIEKHSDACDGTACIRSTFQPETQAHLEQDKRVLHMKYPFA